MPQILYLPFDGNILDGSGNGHDDGTNTDVTFVGGQFGQGGSFNGITSYINMEERILPAGAATYTTWIYLLDLNETYSIFSQYGSSAGDGFLRTLKTTGRMRLWRWTGSGTTIQYWTSTLIVPIGQWSFIAAAYDGINTVVFHLNGVSESRTPATTTWGRPAGNLLIGRESTAFIPATLDELRFFNEALTESEIVSLYKHNYRGLLGQKTTAGGLLLSA